jgi:tRNA(Ile)-lysidine synthase TilS/MesJ
MLLSFTGTNPAIINEFAKHMKQMNLSPDHRVLVAVSGGADSMTLTLLAASYFRLVHAITIDHALRHESSTEAKQVHLEYVIVV